MDSNRKIQELQNLNQELEKSCNDLKHQLKIVNEKLHKSEQYKSNFFSNITNEIINPFTSIIGLTQVIMSTDKNNQDVINELIILVHSEAFNLDLQLRNIFYAAEIESGEFAIENCEINM
ncbi:sensor histidine kinase, partial [Bacteroidota bacterium]